MIFVIRKEKWI